MLKRGVLIFVFLILISVVFALNSDFNNDNKIDFDDFFLFAEEYGKNVDANNVRFDLDGNNKIDVEDFFIFADEFGKLIGDFNKDNCVDQKDLDLANNEIDIISKQFWFKIGTLDAFRGFDYYNVRYNGTDAALISQISALNQKYDLNKDGYVFSRPTDEGVGFIYWAKKDYDIFKSNLGAGCQKEIVQKPADLEIAKKPVDFKLLRAYHFNFENFRDRYDYPKRRFKVSPEEIISDKDSFEFTEEEYDALTRDDGFVAQSLGNNTILFEFRVPSDADEADIYYVLKSAYGEIGYSVYSYPKLKDGFDTDAYKKGETRTDFSGYGAGYGEVEIPAENGKAYLIIDSNGRYSYYIDRMGVV